MKFYQKTTHTSTNTNIIVLCKRS